MNGGRRILIGAVFALFAVQPVWAAKDGPVRHNFQEYKSGGSGGQPRQIRRTWNRADGAKVDETLTFGVKTRTFKNAQSGVYLNAGRASLSRTTEGANLRTVVQRQFTGEKKGTRTTKTWKTNRYDFSLVTSSVRDDKPGSLTINDRVTGTSVTIDQLSPRKQEVKSYNYRTGKVDEAQVAEMTERGKAILKSRKLPF